MKYGYPLYNVKDCNSFAEFFDFIQNNYAERVAFQSKSEIWTYREVCEYIKKCVCEFNSIDNYNIYINVKNSCYFIIAFLSVILSGKVAYLIKDVDMNEDVPLEINDENIKDMIAKNKKDNILCFKATALSPYETCVVISSSGTTAPNKGIMLSQTNLLTDIISCMRMYEFDGASTYLNVVPNTHLFGLLGDLIAPLYSGAKICFSDNPIGFFSDLSFFQPTVLNLPPVLVDSICKMLIATSDPKKATGGRLKKILCGGGRMNPSVNDTLLKYGIRAYAAYGLTECSPCVSIERDMFFKENSVGQVLPCCEIKIDNGEIAVKGSNVMRGYFNDEITTNSIIRNGWLYTGDLGYLDDDGFLYITGRLSNMIVFEDGKKLIPESLEQKINELKGVIESKVKESTCDRRVLLSIIVVVNTNISNELEQQIKQLCRQTGLLQRLSKISFQHKELPKNLLGKLFR